MPSPIDWRVLKLTAQPESLALTAATVTFIYTGLVGHQNIIPFTSTGAFTLIDSFARCQAIRTDVALDHAPWMTAVVHPKYGTVLPETLPVFTPARSGPAMARSSAAPVACECIRARPLRPSPASRGGRTSQTPAGGVNPSPVPITGSHCDQPGVVGWPDPDSTSKFNGPGRFGSQRQWPIRMPITRSWYSGDARSVRAGLYLTGQPQDRTKSPAAFANCSAVGRVFTTNGSGTAKGCESFAVQ